MKIALAHYRVGQTDGVSLEMAKWKTVLESMGHEVIYLSGSKCDGHIYIPGLEYENKENLSIRYRAFEHCDDEQSLRQDIDDLSHSLTKRIVDEIRSHQIDLIIANNIFSLGHNLAAGVAFHNAALITDTLIIAHHHDFHWERERYSKPTSSFVSDILRDFFPPKEGILQHVVINSLAQQSLRNACGLESTIIPNVFDFADPAWQRDEFNSHLREDVGIGPNDIMLLQATRISRRKAIELAIEVAAYLNHHRARLYGPLYDGRIFGSENKLVLFMAGLMEGATDYANYLTELAAKRQVEVVWGNHLVAADRQCDTKRIYSLWDTYAVADLVTYPSVLEGWGNQFLETVFAKQPMVVYEYPVYQSDIAPLGFKTASLGNTHQLDPEGYVKIPATMIQKAGDQCIRYLKDPQFRKDSVEHNFLVGERHLSYPALQKMLWNLLPKNSA